MWGGESMAASVKYVNPLDLFSQSGGSASPPSVTAEEQETIERLFRMTDTSGNAELELSEFSTLLMELGLPMSKVEIEVSTADKRLQLPT